MRPLDGKDEAADRRSEEEAEIPGVRRDRHVAPAETRRGEVGHERTLHRSLEALAEPEEDHGEGEDRYRGGGIERGSADKDEDPRDCPEHAHDGERAHAAAPFEELRDRQLSDRHDHGVQEEDEPDLTLAHAGLVLREHR
jgi:hypothetical protein